MSNGQHSEKPRVTLEQLLHLKRSERPDPSFWNEFDRELHRRQLAAVVSVEPWYVRLSRGARTLVRRTAPYVTATAAVAVAGILFLNRSQPAVATTAQNVTTEPSEDTPFVEAPVEQLAPMDVSADETTKEPTRMPAATVPGYLAEARYVVPEVAATAVQSAKFVSITSPDTLPAADFDSNAHSVSALSGANVYRTSAYSAVGSY